MQLKNAFSYLGVCVLVVNGCASGRPSNEGNKYQKIVVDSSTRGGDAPKWVSEGSLVWEEGGNVRRRGQSSIMGNQRLNACYETAKVDAKVGLLTEIQEEIKGYLDTGETGFSEDIEGVFSRAVTSNFAGRIQGLQFRENYFERYLVGEKERIDCFVLSSIKKEDFVALKRSILNKISELDPRIRELAIQKQMALFKGSNAPDASNTSDGERARKPLVPREAQQDSLINGSNNPTRGTNETSGSLVGQEN